MKVNKSSFILYAKIIISLESFTVLLNLQELFFLEFHKSDLRMRFLIESYQIVTKLSGAASPYAINGTIYDNSFKSVVERRTPLHI